MFLFIGCLMAVVQGGYVRRIPQGKEKATVLRGLLIIVPSFAIIGFAQTKVRRLLTTFSQKLCTNKSTIIIRFCLRLCKIFAQLFIELSVDRKMESARSTQFFPNLEMFDIHSNFIARVFQNFIDVSKTNVS
jgi:hypothetical protein